MSGPESTCPERDLGAIRDGDSAAFVAHLERWVDRMHDASQDIVGTTDAAAAVCHDVVQSLWERRGDLTADELSGEALLLATRQRSLDHLASHGWSPPDTDSLSGAHHDSSATRYRVILAHAAATVIGAGNVSLLDLHFRHGVAATALSDALGVAAAAAPRRLAQLRCELDEAIAAYALWSGAGSRCPGLGDATDFDTAVFATVNRHRSTCPECAREHRSIVNPAGLFITAPITTVAPALRQRMLSVASNPHTPSAATVAAPITATTLHDAGAAGFGAAAGAAGFGAAAGAAGSGAAAGAGAEPSGVVADIDELWTSTAGPAPAPRFVPVTPSRTSARPRRSTVVGGVAVVLAMLAGGAALAMRGSDGGERIVVDRGSNSEQPPTSANDPEVQSLGPVPPSTERRTTTTSTAASTSTTSSTVPATEPAATPATTTETQVATGVPPRPTSTRPSTPTSTVASSPVTTTPATAPPSATTTAPTLPPETTTAPTTTEAATTTTTTTIAPTTTATTTTTIEATTTTTALGG